MKKEDLINHLEDDLREITDRITELELKESNGTITTSSDTWVDDVLDELNELSILKDHYNLELYNRVIEKIRDGQFSSVHELQSYLSNKITAVESRVENYDQKQDEEVEVTPVPQQEFTDTITLDRILFRIRKLMKE